MAEVELQIERQRDLSDLDSPTVRKKGRERGYVQGGGSCDFNGIT